MIRIVQEQAQQFINDLFGKLRERMIDLRSGKAVFVGGGSILLKKQIEASGKVGAPIFVDEISANSISNSVVAVLSPNFACNSNSLKFILIHLLP